MMHASMPPIERVRNVVTYIPETGEFIWNMTLSNSAIAGSYAGSLNSKGYVHIKIDGRQYKAHRLAWFYIFGTDPADSEIDHIDRNKSNNAIGNLRLASRKQNNENINVPRNSTSGVRGVSYQKKDKLWTAYIYHNKKRIHLGSFKSLEGAAFIRKQAEQQLFTHIGIKE